MLSFVFQDSSRSATTSGAAAVSKAPPLFIRACADPLPKAADIEAQGGIFLLVGLS